MHSHGSTDRPDADAASLPYPAPADGVRENLAGGSPQVDGSALAISLPAGDVECSGRSLTGLRRFLASLGPGLITGAADDDPSAITTYSIAGAAYGYRLLWTAVFVFPLLSAVQLMCARLGMVSGQGLGSVLRVRYGPWVAGSACLLLVVANTCQIAADLSGLGEVLAMLTGVSARLWPPLIAALLLAMMSRLSYREVSRVFKWLALALFAYVGAAVLARPNWFDVAEATLVPRVAWSPGGLATLVGILGSVVSPYIFFWQTAQVVDNERELGRRTALARRGVTAAKLKASGIDVVTGMAFACLVMYFIMLTAGSTLYPAGERAIETAPQAAAALRPLAGRGAYLLFSLGFIGAGMLGVPALAGSGARAIAETTRLRHRFSLHRRGASLSLYLLVGLGLAAGVALDYVGLTPVEMLFWAAVLNGVLAAPLVVLVVLLTSDARVMREHVNPKSLCLLGWLTALLLSAAAAMLLLSACGVIG
jgi:NRAMP (natural resistance-associated macrophage protein)-like metal ion transporter